VRLCIDEAEALGVPMAAEDLAVSASFSVKLVARHRRTGLLAPERQGRPRGTGKLEPH
jgi:hypothetical protein